MNNQAKFQNFITKNKLGSLREDEKRRLYDLYEGILQDLKYYGKKGKTFSIGKLSMNEIRALGIALKEFAPKFNGVIKIRTEIDQNKKDR